MIQKLKEHQELMKNNLKEDFKTNLMYTLRVLNLMKDNQEDINYQLSKETIRQNDEENQIMMAMKDKMEPNNLMIEQLMKQIVDMKSQLQCLVIGKGSRMSSTSDLVNPKIEQPWKRYCWSCACCTHWVEIALIKRQDIKMKHHSGIS